MDIINSLKIAFLTYSKLPVGKADWSEKNMKYVMIFFPIVGLVLGLIYFAIAYLGMKFKINSILLAIILTVTPLLFTGGFHFDGYVDTIDAKSSYADKEKKRSILKDPHVGAFGVIYAIIYILVYFGFTLIYSNIYVFLFVGLGFILSRLFSAFAVINYKNCFSGSLEYVRNATEKKVTNVILMIDFIAIVVVGILINWKYSIILFVACGLAFLKFLYITKKEFEGISGDLSGYFVCICELYIVVFFSLYEVVLKCI